MSLRLYQSAQEMSHCIGTSTPIANIYAWPTQPPPSRSLHARSSSSLVQCVQHWTRDSTSESGADSGAYACDGAPALARPGACARWEAGLAHARERNSVPMGCTAFRGASFALGRSWHAWGPTAAANRLSNYRVSPSRSTESPPFFTCYVETFPATSTRPTAHAFPVHVRRRKLAMYSPCRNPTPEAKPDLVWVKWHAPALVTITQALHI
ncbi:hypothetical protein BS50DRAFT_108979 [Corynespora cassiicola Philippines]|uniref:Uncharacterized protein n=1 Tax=Corynespora cassiicola Philippines TaxID=1448308 RepID=A0A2T2NCU8_CORCC|nr:hypothetical protein BS50DRAFT_108979 [Corynespora cassiicola Philippines]